MNDRKFRWGIREKLTLLFFGVTLIAVSVNFLMVVPRLEQRLRGERVEAMENAANRFGSGFNNLAATYDPTLLRESVPGVWEQPISQIAITSGDRVALLKREQRLSPLDGEFSVSFDPTGEAQQGARVSDTLASEAVLSKQLASGVSDSGKGLQAEAAVPLVVNDQAVGAVVFTTSLEGVTAVVKQQARRNIIAGIIALSVALIAGLIASSYIARRLRRLELAAREVSKGNFTEPLPVDSDDEIGEVARAFNTMQSRLGQADRARKAFIANASHELRTPLFSLGGYVELMREEELDAETQREFLDIMHDQIKRMTQLATDLLDLSKIDTGSLDIAPERVDLNELAKGILREFEPQLLEHDSELALEVAPGLVAICDPDRIAQIARILINNVLSHTPSGTDVELKIEQVGAGITMTVADNGPGIDPEDLPRVFERFHTGDKTGGTGLGLSIADELATAMGGSMSVQSDSSGTAFTLSMPVAFEAPPVDAEITSTALE
jgi:signal transduction histidine kinase